MKIIYVLIPLSLMLLSLAVWAFFWAVRNDQFDDLDTPAMDILDDHEPSGENNKLETADDAECADEKNT